MALHDEDLSERVIAAAMAVHRALGPGLLESAYEACLCAELKDSGLSFDRQRPLRIHYKTAEVECGYRMDLVVEDRLLIELKSVEKLLPIHEAQLITYLKLSGLRTGLLMNFNAQLLKDGIKRKVV